MRKFYIPAAVYFFNMKNRKKFFGLSIGILLFLMTTSQSIIANDYSSTDIYIHQISPKISNL